MHSLCCSADGFLLQVLDMISISGMKKFLLCLIKTTTKTPLQLLFTVPLGFFSRIDSDRNTHLIWLQPTSSPNWINRVLRNRFDLKFCRKESDFWGWKFMAALGLGCRHVCLHMLREEGMASRLWEGRALEDSQVPNSCRTQKSPSLSCQSHSALGNLNLLLSRPRASAYSKGHTGLRPWSRQCWLHQAGTVRSHLKPHVCIKLAL